jgi:hypothetical protein
MTNVIECTVGMFEVSRLPGGNNGCAERADKQTPLPLVTVARHLLSSFPAPGTNFSWPDTEPRWEGASGPIG